MELPETQRNPIAKGQERGLNNIEDPKDLNVILAEDRKLLMEWCEMSPSSAAFWFHMGKKLGGPEGVAFKFNNILLDSDGSGNFSAQELQAAEESQKKMIDNFLSNLTTSGVIGALLISVLLPVAYADIVPADAAVEYFSPAVLQGFRYTAAALIYTGLTSSFIIVLQTAGIYKMMSFWMVTTEMKMSYLHESDIGAIFVLTMFAIFCPAVALPFVASVTSGPLHGLYGAILALLGLVYFYTKVEGAVFFKMTIKQHVFIKRHFSKIAVQRPGTGTEM